ncbi:PREDICTED: translation initiation factor IF-2-like, partial [Chinchilla lanigera]|uniref:translation initiation factor IF-2-like n=1 Tax=Chinchilla lanigera TaxID=34839 RepID=UPI000698B413
MQELYRLPHFLRAGPALPLPATSPPSCVATRVPSLSPLPPSCSRAVTPARRCAPGAWGASLLGAGPAAHTALRRGFRLHPPRARRRAPRTPWWPQRSPGRGASNSLPRPLGRSRWGGAPHTPALGGGPRRAAPRAPRPERSRDRPRPAEPPTLGADTTPPA